MSALTASASSSASGITPVSTPPSPVPTGTPATSSALRSTAHGKERCQDRSQISVELVVASGHGDLEIATQHPFGSCVGVTADRKKPITNQNICLYSASLITVVNEAMSC